jgi:rhamnulokinase
VTETQSYLALDLGASGGRAIIGRYDGDALSLEEVHRFANGPVQVPRAGGSSLHWDILDLFGQVKQGIASAVGCCKEGLVSVGLDTWGVDFGLLDAHDELLGNPYHYRDSRTDGMVEEACWRVPREEIFGITGIQFMQLNTMIQLVAMAAQRSPMLDVAQTLLMVPDLLNYWLTGRKVSEYTIASTSQLLDARSRVWSVALAERLGIPSHIFPEIVEPGTVLGPLLPWVGEETGGHGLAVVAVGAHDTASAVAAVPARGEDYAYLSSGTWSLMGVAARAPVINDVTLEYNFTNEGGVGNTIRLLKNITGLWVIQECRRAWAREVGAVHPSLTVRVRDEPPLSWDEITQRAEAAPAFTALIDVDAPDFLTPGDMPQRIRDYAARTGQPAPQDVGEVARAVLESLALKYRWTLERLDRLTGRRISTLHIVGGGTQNRLLSQFAADATGRTLVAGPVEATAVGNILMQMLAVGAIGSLEEGREIVRRSFNVEVFEPADTPAWNDAYARFTAILKR